MPVLDTVVLFAALSKADPRHEKALYYMGKLLEEEDYYISAMALVELDVVLKSRRFSDEQRMDVFALLAADYPNARISPLSPMTFYLAAKIEKEYGLEYFDACVAAEALLLDGVVVSTDQTLDRVAGLRRIW